MPPEAAAAEIEEDSILATVTNAYEALEAEEDEASTEQNTESEESAGDAESATDTPADGKAEETSAEAETTETPAEATDAASGDDTDASTETHTAPEHWSESDRTMFAEQTPEGQAFLLKRQNEMEADYTRKTQEHAEILREYEPVRAIMSPFKQSMQQLGLSEAEVIRRWAAAESSLNANPVSAIKQLAATYKVDLSQLSGSQPEGADPYFEGNEQQDDPRVQQLETTVGTLVSTMQNEALTRANQQIENFKNTKSDDGALKYPFFDELEPAITRLAAMQKQAGQPIDLDDLYEQAAWSTQSTRKQLLDSQHQAESEAAKAKEADRVRQQREKAEKAKAASKSVRSSSEVGATSAGAENKNSTLRQDVEAAYEKASSKI